MYVTTIIIAFFWGIGPASPMMESYLYGMSVGDFLFVMYLLVAFFVGKNNALLIKESIFFKKYSLVLFIFVMLTMVSALVNAFYLGIYWRDMFEALRPLYYLAGTLFLVNVVQRRGYRSILTAFLSGTLFSVLINYAYVSNQDWVVVEGFVVLYKSNVIGNLIGVGLALTSLLILDRAYGRSVLFFTAFLVFGIFTYSKGVWIMLVLGIAANYIAFRYSTRNFFPQEKIPLFFIKCTWASVFFLVIMYSSDLYSLLEFKINTTQVNDTAQDGGTFAARWGFVLASINMALSNPILGVGISNYEIAYDQLENVLGEFYWPTDNPHNAFMYVLACIGFPATFAFLFIFVYPFFILKKANPIGGWSGKLYVFLIFLVFFVSANVQLELLSQHFFWVFVGIVLGWHRRNYVEKRKLCTATRSPVSSHGRFS